jgi:3-hydroxyisobutyrate dehydrogenase-like beta-hydroxyacid dehydrogenase
MPEKIGFVGVGRMGANMARRLKDVGYPVAAVFDVRADAAAEVAKEIGAEACRELARVTQLSDVIRTVVTDDAAMRKIFTDRKDNLLRNASGKIFINCATITPSVHVEVERLAMAAGARSLEACMASSITQARNGLLYLMLGGSQETFERVKPVLEKLAASMRYVGPAGNAAEVKALVNMVMNINTAGLAEGLGLGEALGLDLNMLREVFSQTGANSRVLETDGEDMQNREHSCYFSAEHAAKDSGIALSLAREQGLDLPLADATYQQYARMTALGLGALDKSGIAELTFKGRAPRQRAAAAASRKTAPARAGSRPAAKRAASSGTRKSSAGRTPKKAAARPAPKKAARKAGGTARKAPTKKMPARRRK